MVKRPPKDPKEEIDGITAAGILDLTPSWLAQMRTQKKGPPFHKRGRSVFYIRGEVEAYKAGITTNGKAMLVVELKTLAIMPDGQGGHTIEVNGKKHTVDPSASALLIAPSTTK